MDSSKGTNMETRNLLLIDDEEQILLNLRILLKKYASTIFIASSAKEGLKILRANEIHCVVCDISMPEMTGVELIKQIREDGNDVPFVFYTAFCNHELMREAAKYGAFDFLTKPEFEDLHAVVSRGLSEGFKRKSEEKTDENDTVYETILNDFLKATGEDT